MGLRRLAAPLIALALCAVLMLGAQRLSRSLDYHAVMQSLRAMPLRALAGALAGTVLSYLGIVGRDAVALRALGAKPPRPILWIGAVAGSALGNAVGFGVLTGGMVRVRVYGAAGMRPGQVARLSVLTSSTFGLGLVGLTGLGLLGAAPSIAPLLRCPPGLVFGAGAAVVLVLAAVLIGCRPGETPLRLGRVRLDLPARRVLVQELLLVGVDVAGAALTLWSVMPASGVGLPGFLALFTAAMLLGMIGHTPGGIGVFETAMVLALGRHGRAAGLAAALLMYRLIYFALPLLLSAALLAGFETRTVAARLPRGVKDRSAGIAQLAPTFLGVVAFAIGGMLVISGALPAFKYRLELLQTAVPLWIVEGSHLLASVLGVLLLFVARGLFRRLDAAWFLAMAIAVISLALSFAKGLAFVEAGLLTCLILLLAATRHQFNRKASLFEARFTFGWLVSISIVLAVAFWFLFFAFRNVPYSHDLWWQFEFDSKAPRSLRATMGATLFAAALALWQLIRPAAGRFARPERADLLKAAAILRAQERSEAMLAMMGDKNFLFSASGKALLMYAKRGRSWVALYDPVGPREEWPDLITRFVDMAHRHAGRAAFYQVRAEALPLYLDAGLKLMKLGEEARIPLLEFGLEGSRRTHLRYAIKRGERDGLGAEVVRPENMPDVLPELRAVSDAWLRSRRAREKGFSVAAFGDDYLAAQSVMVVRQHGTAVAFATFMTTDLHLEATVGVMRHSPDSSAYAMEYLFTKLALHLKAAGYRDLHLGMAPLAGLAPRPLASSWHHIGHALWRLGGRLYNFQGLRTFKNKFGPVWEPRYLAASGTLGPFITLTDLAVLAGAGRP